MSIMRILTVAMLVAWLGCLALSERPLNAAQKNDEQTESARGGDADSADFDPLEARPAGIIRSRNYKAPPKKKPKLPPEGSKMVDRLCRITTDPSGWVLAWFPAEGDRKAVRPRWALPNKILEAMETIQAKNPKLRFRVSGEMTIYGDNSFILIRRIAIIEPPEEPEPEPVAPIQIIVKPTPATQPTTQPAAKTDTQPAEAPSSTDLMKALLAEKNPTPVIIPRRKEKVAAAKIKSVAPGARGDVIEPATARLIVDRLMTIRQTDKAMWRDATFEADNTLREPPVTLLPCQLLKYAEIQPPSRRLRVTGELTKYKGKRYMLLRKVIIERKMDRL